jgi:hypothetical protein
MILSDFPRFIFQGCGENFIREKGFMESLSDHQMKSWKDVENKNCKPQYQIKEFNEKEEKLKTNSENFFYTIGTEKCDSKRYCNGELKPGTNYKLTLRVFTSAGFADSVFVPFETKTESAFIWIIVSILLIICIGFAVTIFILYRRRQMNSYYQPDVIKGMSKDISMNDFENIHETLILTDKEKMLDEFYAIENFSHDVTNTCNASKMNGSLNRYSNIFPFDYNRVVLDDDEHENEYINASYINVREKKIKLIFSAFLKKKPLYMSLFRPSVVRPSVARPSVVRPSPHKLLNPGVYRALR